MGPLVYIVALVILIIMTPERSETFNSNYNLLLSIIYLVVVIFHLYMQTKLTKNWLRFDVLFLIGFTIVHIQIPYLASIGIEPSNPDFVWINRNVVNFATWMSVVSAVLWMWGYNFMVGRKTFSKKVNHKVEHIKISVNYVKYDLVLLSAFLLFLGLVGSGFFRGVYDGGDSWGVGANYAYLVLSTLLYLRIIYFFKDIKIGSSIYSIVNNFFSQKIFITIVTIYVLLFLMSGDRGPVLQIALIVSGSYTIFVKTIPLRKLILFSVIGAVAFSIISYGRGADADNFEQGNIFERGYTSFQQQESGIVTEELATSVRIQYIALDVVPSAHPYLNGLTFFTVGIGVIPFMSAITIDSFNIPPMYTSSSNFFTILTKGPNPNSGAGSEILADIYINFGLLLTFFIMLLFGIFAGHVYNKTVQLHFVYTLLFIILLYSSLGMNRGMLFGPLKDIVYILFFNFLFAKIIK